MKPTPYSSLAAFLAHYRALRSAASRSSEEDRLFAEMSAANATLSAEERAALDSSAATSSARRNRERAELHLKRELRAHAILSD
jgi:alpha-ketoglutarate-dependent taurine dioxygenase